MKLCRNLGGPLTNAGLKAAIMQMSQGRNGQKNYPTSVVQLALLGIQLCIQYFGIPPKDLIVPYNVKQLEVLSALIDDWAILRCSFQGNFDNHFPKNPILQLITTHPIVFPHITSKDSLPDAPSD